ncbi:MAG: phage tail protein [Parasporobacterium sp.]|nr:phage tail protein [Parasporobacterium sp.]
MIIYFADRNLDVTGLASTNLPGGFRITDDLTTEEIDSGVNVFTCRISYNDCSRAELEEAVSAGRFILKSGGSAFSEKENSYDSLYQIIETEFDTQSQELYVYAEDAGLELINKVVSGMTLKDKTLLQMLRTFLPAGWTVNLVGTPTGTKSYTWDGESTATERINSVVNLFGCEAYYSFEIERFKITAKVINVVPKRGSQVAAAQLRLNLDIDRIVTKTSISDMATAFAVTGGTPEGKNVPINLKGYSYNYTDPQTGDVYAVDKTTGQMRNTSAMKRWSSAIDADGLILKRYSYNTTNKAVLAGQARAELQKCSREAVEYEVDFVRLPEGVQVGDRINIIDEAGKLYLEARLLKIETSVTGASQVATIGEYVLKDSGISGSVAAIAREFSERVKNGIDGTTLSVTSSGGNVFHNAPIETTLIATVFFGERAITDQEELEEVYGEGAAIRWYDSEEALIGTGFTIQVSSGNLVESYKARLET